MMKLTRLLQASFILPFILVAVTILVSVANYQPGTWLSGWDTIHPEFNFGLYLSRIFFGVWQEHQGLGAVAAQAHAAELPRMLIYYPLSLILPASALRYSYFFLTLILGPLGVYFFILKMNRSRLAAFAGGLFYLFNLATLQQFYVPLEMFATHYAALPWLFLLATNYLDKSKKSLLCLYLLASLLSAPMAHTATLFYAFFIALALYLVTVALGKYPRRFKPVAILLGTTILIHSFWLLPNLYFVAHHGADVASAKIHEQFSEKAFLTGKKYGTIADTAILRNFLFDWGEFDDDKGQFVTLFDEWKPYLADPLVKTIQYGLFGLVLAGIVVSFRKQSPVPHALLPVFALSFILIANDNPLTNSLFAALADHAPVVKEALRFPFTKFSLLLAFTYAVYFSQTIKELENRLLISRRQKGFFAGIIMLAFSLTFLPFYFGNLVSPSMRVNIPSEYFELFNYFSQQPKEGRIGLFPVHSFWGWVYYRWQYEGAGFLWFGLPQALLDREFDRWMPTNEQYYWEISYALYNKNLPLLESVLEKYQVTTLVVDENVISPDSPQSLYINVIEDFFSQSPKIALVQTFGHLRVYSVNLTAKPDHHILLANNLPAVAPFFKWNNLDQAYLDLGNYISPASPHPSLPATHYFFYPFRTLFTNKRQADLEFAVNDDGRNFIFTSTIPRELAGSQLVIPLVDKREMTEVNASDPSRQLVKMPAVFLDDELVPYSTESSTTIDLPYIKNGRLTVIVPKILGYTSYDSTSDNSLVNLPPRSCDAFNTGDFNRQTLTEGQEKLSRFTSSGSSNCVDIGLPNLSQEQSYLVTIQSRNVDGKSLLFSVINNNSGRADPETYLPQIVQPKTNDQRLATSYFILPPMSPYAAGYTLHFDNVAIGRDKTVNDLGAVTVNPIPYRFLTSLKIVKEQETSPLSSPLLIGEGKGEVLVNHPNPSLYLVNLNHETMKQWNNETLVLSQSFDQGWKAYRITNYESGIMKLTSLIFPFFVGEELKDHALVNNWANGWELSNLPKAIIIVYLPQYLEYIGFIVLSGVFGYFAVSGLWLFARGKVPQLRN